MSVQLGFSLSVCAASQGFAFGKGSGNTGEICGFGRGMVGPLAFQHLPAKLLRPFTGERMQSSARDAVKPLGRGYHVACPRFEGHASFCLHQHGQVNLISEVCRWSIVVVIVRPTPNSRKAEFWHTHSILTSFAFWSSVQMPDIQCCHSVA